MRRRQGHALSPAFARHCRNLTARYSKVMVAVEAIRQLVNGGFDLYTSRTAENTRQEMHADGGDRGHLHHRDALRPVGRWREHRLPRRLPAFFVWSALGISLLVVATVA